MIQTVLIKTLSGFVIKDLGKFTCNPGNGMMVRILLIIILMWGCDNPHRVISDAGTDIPDVPEDIDSDIQDAPDVHDADVTDTTDATEITEDPHEVLITCDKIRISVHYPWMYSDKLKLETTGGWTTASLLGYLAALNVLTGEEGTPPPLVMENIYGAFPAVKGRPELIFFSGGEGPITSSEPRIPTGRKYYYLWDRNTDVVRRITLLPISYGSGGLVGGQVPPVTAFYSRQGGSYPCYYHKNLYESGIMDINGNLLPESK